MKSPKYQPELPTYCRHCRSVMAKSREKTFGPKYRSDGTLNTDIEYRWSCQKHTTKRLRLGMGKHDSYMVIECPDDPVDNKGFRRRAIFTREAWL